VSVAIHRPERSWRLWIHRSVSGRRRSWVLRGRLPLDYGFTEAFSGRRRSWAYCGRLPLPPGGPTFREGWGEGTAV